MFYLLLIYQPIAETVGICAYCTHIKQSLKKECVMTHENIEEMEYLARCPICEGELFCDDHLFASIDCDNAYIGGYIGQHLEEIDNDLKILFKKWKDHPETMPDLIIDEIKDAFDDTEICDEGAYFGYYYSYIALLLEKAGLMWFDASSSDENCYKPGDGSTTHAWYSHSFSENYIDFIDSHKQVMLSLGRTLPLEPKVNKVTDKIGKRKAATRQRRS
jgi:hypothetical protein